MLNGQLLIDFHVHLPQYAERTNSALEWFRSLCPSPEVYDAVSQTCADPANFTAMLERKGVDYAVLLAEMTPSVSGVVSNETIAAFCAQSGRLIPFCTFDPHRGGDLAAELHRLAGMGFRGVKLYPTYNYFYPNDAALYPLYGAAQELEMPVMYHTGLSVFQNSRIKYGNPIFLDDVAVDFPDLTLVMSHGGRGRRVSLRGHPRRAGHPRTGQGHERGAPWPRRRTRRLRAGERLLHRGGHPRLFRRTVIHMLRAAK